MNTSRGFQKCVLSFVREKYYYCLDCLRGWVRRSERRVLQARGTMCKDLERRMILVHSRGLNIFTAIELSPAMDELERRLGR